MGQITERSHKATRTKRKNESNQKLSEYKKSSIKVARQLCYKPYILERIENATSEMEVDRIMALGRKEL